MNTQAKTRIIALTIGALSGVMFLYAVYLMMWGLWSGMAYGHSHFPPPYNYIFDLMLLIQFPLLHSLFLNPKGSKILSKLGGERHGRTLITTIFAAFASLQLLIVFYLWSPLTPNIHREQSILWIVNIPYLLSWALLLKAMADAGLGVQIGYLGWTSMFRGVKPNYKPFPQHGLYKYSRHPIYWSFLLILVTGPIWNIDHILIASIWGTYCLIGPILKDRRYLARFGDDYRVYCSRVSYFFGFPKSQKNLDHDAD